MRWMRRTGAAILVAALVVLIPLPGGETPASAADLPPEVVPVPGLPSTGQAVWTDSDDYMVEYWKRTGQKGGAYQQPVTKPTVPRRGITGNPYLDIAATAFVVTTAGVRVVADLSGHEVLPSVCGSGIEGVAALFYPDEMPDCSLEVLNPNVDAATGWTASTWMGGRLDMYPATGREGYCLVLSPLPTAPWSSASSRSSWRDPVTGGTVFVGIRGNGGWIWTPDWTTANFGMGSYCRGNPKAYVVAGIPSGGSLPFVFVTSGAAVSGSTAGVQASGDPLRDATCRITWSDGSVTTGFAGQYRESEGFPIGAVAASCTSSSGEKVAQGLLPESLVLESTDTETGSKTQIATGDVPDFTESQKVGLTPGDNSGLRLLKVVNSVTMSCMTWEAACVDWWGKTSAGTVSTTDEGTYRCEYGGREVALSECGVYRHTFDARTESPTITNPNTGEQVDWMSRTDPANSLQPGPGSAQSSDRCVVSFSLNPVDWVMRPLRCLFEPRAAKVQEAQSTTVNAWRNSALGAWSTAITSWSFVPPTSGCDGLVLPFGQWYGHGVNDVRLLKACPGDPLAPVATASSLVLTILTMLGTIYSVTRSLGGVVGTRGLGD